MEKLNLENYFNEIDKKYYEPKILITILEDILNKKFNNIKNNVNNSEITITEKEITEFLEKKFVEEEPEVKKRLESPKKKRSSNFVEWTKEDIEDSSQEFSDKLTAAKYCFESYSLKYFKTYTDIVKNKAIQLLNIIENIANKNNISIKDILTNLDIILDENGNISKEDIIRLITPTIYNINLLNEKITTGNDLCTYLTFKISKDSLYRCDLSEGEIYPTKSIQVKSIHCSYLAGNVPLSINQEKELDEQLSRSMKILVKDLLD